MARKRGMQFIPYDYEAAYNKAMEDMHEWFIENLFQHRKKVIYALKEITAGDQFEIEIYPQFRSKYLRRGGQSRKTTTRLKRI